MENLKRKFEIIIGKIESDYQAEKEQNGENMFIEDTIAFLEEEFKKIIKTETKAKIKKIVTITDESEYYCGEYIYGRYYKGIYGGEDYRSDGRYIKVDNNWIKIGNGTKIEFSEEIGRNY